MRTRPGHMPRSVTSHHARGNRKGSRERTLEVTESKDAATGGQRSRMPVVDGVVLQMCVAVSQLHRVAPGHKGVAALAAQAPFRGKDGECFIDRLR